MTPILIRIVFVMKNEIEYTKKYMINPAYIIIPD